MIWSDWFYYDETSVSYLRWKVDRYACGLLLVSANDVAGTIGGQCYYRVQLQNKIYTVHRIIWEMFYGEIPEGFEIDHKDLDETNNKFGNLRLVSKQANCRNRSLRSDSTTGVNSVNRRLQTHPSGNTYASWLGRYCQLDGKRVSRSFSVSKYGEDSARQMAIDFVESMREKYKGEDLFSDNHGNTKTKEEKIEEFV